MPKQNIILFLTKQRRSILTGNWRDVKTFTKPIDQKDWDLYSALAEKILNAGGSVTQQMSSDNFVTHMILTSKRANRRTIFNFRLT